MTPYWKNENVTSNEIDEKMNDPSFAKHFSQRQENTKRAYSLLCQSLHGLIILELDNKDMF